MSVYYNYIFNKKALISRLIKEVNVMQHLSEQEIKRRQYREELYAMGINPYPAEMFVINTIFMSEIYNYIFRQISK